MQEEDSANAALVIFTLPMMCRSILSSLTEACTLQVHASEMLIDNNRRHLLTKPVGESHLYLKIFEACIEGTQWQPI